MTFSSRHPRVRELTFQKLITQKVSDMNLEPRDTLRDCLIQLRHELQRRHISFFPHFYFGEEPWGCVDRTGSVEIPFFLANAALTRIASRYYISYSKEEIMMLLRHETGHAITYVYKLWKDPEWRALFGNFHKRYRNFYNYHPNSRDFVRHLHYIGNPHYAQKHPDEDFAETFAVWLTPGSDWQKQYAGTPALAKLEYVDRKALEYGQKPPIVTDEKLDRPVQELTMTLDTWYETGRDSNHVSLNLHRTFNKDLRKLFPADQGPPAADVLRANRIRLIREVNRWTGINRGLLSALTNELIKRVQFLKLKIGPEESAAQLVSVSAFITTLAMNYVYSGQFVDT